MPRTRQPYPPAFRRQIVELARAGRSINELAAEFERLLGFHLGAAHAVFRPIKARFLGP